MSHPSSPLIRVRTWIAIYLVPIAAISICHFFLTQLRGRIYFDMDNYWPVSIFLPKYPVLIDLITFSALLWLIYFAWTRWNLKDLSISKLIVLLAITFISTNALQGMHEGFITPDGGGDTGYVHYYQDTLGIDNPLNLLHVYTAIQPSLRDHPRVHPPGALLVFYFLRIFSNYPIINGLLIPSIGLLSAYFVYLIAHRQTTHSAAIWTAALFGLLPGVQIYFLYSLDAIISTLFIATFYFFSLPSNNFKSQVITVILLWLSTFLTFGSAWLLGVLFFFELINRRSLSRFFTVCLSVLGIYLFIYWISGFNYLESFAIATKYEGPPGFYPMVAPLSYLFTRIEDWLEILIFMGPLVVYLIYQGFILNRNHILSITPTLVAIVIFTGFILTGAYYTGETGRAAAFLYPFLVLPCALWFQHFHPTSALQKKILLAVFTQTIIMQTFGWYGW